MTDDVDQLVEYQMSQAVSRNKLDFHKDKCPLCQHNWHGLSERGCPGAYGLNTT